MAAIVSPRAILTYGVIPYSMILNSTNERHHKWSMAEWTQPTLSHCFPTVNLQLDVICSTNRVAIATCSRNAVECYSGK